MTDDQQQEPVYRPSEAIVLMTYQMLAQGTSPVEMAARIEAEALRLFSHEIERAVEQVVGDAEGQHEDEETTNELVRRVTAPIRESALATADRIAPREG